MTEAVHNKMNSQGKDYDDDRVFDAFSDSGANKSVGGKNHMIVDKKRIMV